MQTSNYNNLIKRIQFVILNTLILQSIIEQSLTAPCVLIKLMWDFISDLCKTKAICPLTFDIPIWCNVAL